MNREVRQQTIRLSLFADQAYLAERLQGRFQESLCHELGHHVRHANGHTQGPTDRTVVKRILHLASQTEDLISVTVDNPAALRQRQAATVLGEELMTQPLLQTSESDR